MNHPQRLSDFLARFSQLIADVGDDEARVLAQGEPLLAALVRHDDRLPAEFARESVDGYRQ